MSDPLAEFAKAEMIRTLSLEEALAKVEQAGYISRKRQPEFATLKDIDLSDIKGERVRVGVISDTHHGSIYNQPTLLRKHLAYMKRRKVAAILHCGDVTDGPFSRHRNPHEAWLHSFEATVDYASSKAVYPDLGIPYLFIAGNHDDWWLADGGPDIVKSICEQRDDFTYLGTPNGFVNFGDVLVELMHPNEGGSYALSYKLQKHVEGMSPDEKPHIYLAGNFHKACHVPALRNVEAFLVPSYMTRSHWMRGKRLASIVGGMVLEFGLDPQGLATSLNVEWLIERTPIEHDYPGR